jgi:predicted transcriptional regulator
MADNENNDLITLTADIVSAHVANNAVHTVDIAQLALLWQVEGTGWNRR